MLRCGLLGEKLGHSYSPEIHKMLAGYEYRLYERAADEVEDFVPIEPNLMETLIQTFRITYAPPAEEEADPAE